MIGKTMQNQQTKTHVNKKSDLNMKRKLTMLMTKQRDVLNDLWAPSFTKRADLYKQTKKFSHTHPILTIKYAKCL